MPWDGVHENESRVSREYAGGVIRKKMQEVAGRVCGVCVGEWVYIDNVCVYIRTKVVFIMLFDLLSSFRSKQQGRGLARGLGLFVKC